jgi:hypothetical protein
VAKPRDHNVSSGSVTPRVMGPESLERQPQDVSTMIAKGRRRMLSASRQTCRRNLARRLLGRLVQNSYSHIICSARLPGRRQLAAIVHITLLFQRRVVGCRTFRGTPRLLTAAVRRWNSGRVCRRRQLPERRCFCHLPQTRPGALPNRNTQEGLQAQVCDLAVPAERWITPGSRVGFDDPHLR